ncbi:MAG: hypothetical protein II865_09455 [Bacteroidales bacterium]|nr:hypothetical protein [Bacteroidales bacterium]
MNANKAFASEYIKVGRISMPIAKQAHVKCADIMIDNRHIEHINKKHKMELDTLGISAMDFVKLIVTTFGEIRQAPNDALDLVTTNTEGKNYVAVVTLNYNYKKKFWEIRTALPVRTAVVKSRKLLWKRERTPIKD